MHMRAFSDVQAGYAAEPAWLAQWIDRIDGLPEVIENWRGLCDPPNVTARRNAASALRAIARVALDLEPTEVVPMADEGVLIWLRSVTRGVMPPSVECYNGGAVVFSLSTTADDLAWDVAPDDLAGAARAFADRIRSERTDA